MTRPVGLRMPPSPPAITWACRLAFPSNVGRLSNVSPASGTSPWSGAANVLIAFPFVLEAPTTIYKGFAVTGSAPGNNFEIGITDSAYNKIVSSGSVSGGAVALVPVMADLTDTTLPPGLYYAAMSCDATTTNRWYRIASQTYEWQALGCWQQAAAGPGSFPSPTCTPADITNVALPVFGLIARSAFDV